MLKENLKEQLIEDLQPYAKDMYNVAAAEGKCSLSMENYFEVNDEMFFNAHYTTPWEAVNDLGSDYNPNHDYCQLTIYGVKSCYESYFRSEAEEWLRDQIDYIIDCYQIFFDEEKRIIIDYLYEVDDMESEEE